MKKYDVIIIGAGNGGLAAAVKVLMSGKTCLVLEKHNIPGGFATSFKRGRFEFEASLHEFNGIGFDGNRGSSYELFKELGVVDKIEWVQVKDAYRLICETDDIDFVMPFGREKCIEACEKATKNGGKYMKKIFDLSDNIAGALDYITKMKGHPDKKVMITKYYDYMATASYSVNEVFESLKFSKKFIDIISAYWCYLGVGFDEMSFLHYANMINSYFSRGAVVPKSRSHEMSLALEERIHELGGDIFFNSEVTNILTKDDGSVKGVMLKDGTVYETNHVIANCSPHTVYSKMIDKKHVPVDALKLTNFRKFSGRGLTIFLGLNKSASELGITNHSYFVYDTCDSVKACHEMEKLEHCVGQATCCLNNVVPDASPEGTCILYITTLYQSDCWSSVKEEDYYKFKNKIAKKFIDAFEKATGVNIHDHIEEIAVATPETYARYCLQPQGTIYGYSSIKNDSLMQRIMMADEDAKIKGLRFGGAYGERLIGFPSSYKSGYNEAKRTLKDIQKEEADV